MLLHGVHLSPGITVMVVSDFGAHGWGKLQAVFEQDTESFFTGMSELIEAVNLVKTDHTSPRLAELCSKYGLDANQLVDLDVRTIFSRVNPLDDTTD